MLTYDKRGNAILEAEARIPYELAKGPTWSKFFKGFKDKKILGTRCPKCNRVLVPARSFCPACFVDMDEWVEVSQKGVIQTWVRTDHAYFGMPTKPPFIHSVIKLEGTDCGFIHLIGGFEIGDIREVRKIIPTGKTVKAVWNTERSGCIMDIKYFEPV
ncbi:MAG: hypothetical protein JRJ51_02865 [Deltaproteobacteria bacterium]|nr:hypothetical protein [Deltaproteobacteria bacterium]